MTQVLIYGLTPNQVDDYEAQLELATQVALDRVMATIADHIGKVRLAAATPRILVADASAVSPDDLAAIVPLWQAQVDEELMPVIAQIYRESGGAVHASMVTAAEQVVPQVNSLAAEAYLANAR